MDDEEVKKKSERKKSGSEGEVKAERKGGWRAVKEK